jgi:hypothetical protein
MSYKPLRFIGGPLHNKVQAVDDRINYHAVAKYPKLPARVQNYYVNSTSQLVCKQIVYYRQRVNGIEFMLADHIKLDQYLQGLFGAHPTEKAEKRKRQKERKARIEEHERRQNMQGYVGWTPKNP